MTQNGVIPGQRVSQELLERAKVFRRRPTPAENRLWQALRHHHVGGLHFRRQQVIDGYIVDFYCERAGLVVEVDGQAHDSMAAQGDDEERTQVLSARGLRVIRFRNEHVMTGLESVVSAIRAACAAHE